MEPMFVVTTVFKPKLESPTIHVYGPYTQGKATYQRELIVQDNAELVRKGDLIVKTNKVLNPEGDASFIWARM